jgi:hypothetical protein
LHEAQRLRKCCIHKCLCHSCHRTPVRLRQQQCQVLTPNNRC